VKSARRPALAPTEVVELAITIADREGLAAVSMRRLAREFSVTPMALYWHFDNKDRLLDAMAESVVAGNDFDALPDEGWEQRMRAVLESFVEMLRCHPWMGRVTIERLVPLPSYLAALEVLLDTTRRAGLDTVTGTMLVQHAVQSIVTMVENEPPPPPRPGTAADPECVSRQDFLRNLSVEKFPNLAASAMSRTMSDKPQDYYAVGLAMIIGGIRSIAAAADTGSGSHPTSPGMPHPDQ